MGGEVPSCKEETLLGLQSSGEWAGRLTPLDAVTAACLPSPEHSGLTTGVAFGHHAKFIASTGMDRSLKFYSL